MADVTVWIDTDWTGTESGTESEPYSDPQTAWEAVDADIDGGDNYTFNCKGQTDVTAVQDYDDFGGGGTGKCTVTWQGWPSADDGTYTGTLNFNTAFFAWDMGGAPMSTGTPQIQVDPAQTTNEVDFIMDGLQIKAEGAGSDYAYNLNVGGGGNADCNLILRAMRLINNGPGAFPRCVRMRAGCKSATLTNCILVGAESALNHSASWHNGTTTVLAVNCAFVENNYGSGGEWIAHTSGFSTTAKQCLVYSGDNAHTGTVTVSRNAGDFSADRGTGGVDVTTTSLATNITSPGSADSDDQRPTEAGGAGDYSAIGQTNADDSDVPTVDIRGNARNTAASGSTAAGPFAAAGEGATADQGAGAVSIGVTATGSATARRQGAGAVSIGVTMSGQGTARRQGAGTVDIGFTAAGDGSSAKQGAGGVTIGVTVAGQGTARRQGAGAPTIGVTATGTATARRQGGGTPTIGVTVTGDGTEAGVQQGAGVVSIGVTATATGTARRQGAGAPAISISVTGDGVGGGGGTDTHDGGPAERFPLNKLLFVPEPDPVDETSDNSHLDAQPTLTPTGQAVVDTVLTLSAGDPVLETVPEIRAVRAAPRSDQARVALARAVALGELVSMLSSDFRDQVAARERRAADDLAALIALGMI